MEFPIRSVVRSATECATLRPWALIEVEPPERLRDSEQAVMANVNDGDALVK